ncbi:MAG: hypothetical protein ABR909_04895 [Candidatus Bathyarchaeia archaeon]|jgi:hypothetical protein
MSDLNVSVNVEKGKIKKALDYAEELYVVLSEINTVLCSKEFEKQCIEHGISKKFIKFTQDAKPLLDKFESTISDLSEEKIKEWKAEKEASQGNQAPPGNGAAFQPE